MPAPTRAAKSPPEMTKDELRRHLKFIYGYGGQTRLAEALCVNGSTVRRWCGGSIKIPGPVAMAVRCMAREKRAQKKEAAAGE